MATSIVIEITESEIKKAIRQYAIDNSTILNNFRNDASLRAELVVVHEPTNYEKQMPEHTVKGIVRCD
jgi:uncharacterized protein (UPF0147 family)